MNFNTFRKCALVGALAFGAMVAHAETYALLVGICDYPAPTNGQGNPVKDENGKEVSLKLNGCVNDVKSYNDLLVNKYNVKSENIKLITDRDANEEGFVKGWQWILGKVKAGDQVIFGYSGHGTQIEDKENANNGKDGAIVLADLKLVPGKLFNKISRNLMNQGVHSTYIFDSCFSGGMSRDVVSFNGMPAGANKKFIPNVGGMLRLASPIMLNGVQTKSKGKMDDVKGSYAFVFAGDENQTTTDLHFKDPKNLDHGLFTLVFSMALDKFPAGSLEDLVGAVKSILK